MHYRISPTSNPEKRLPLSNAEQKGKHCANLSEEKKNKIKEDDEEKEKETRDCLNWRAKGSKSSKRKREKETIQGKKKSLKSQSWAAYLYK